jgi:hypothetical protein
MSFNPNDFFTTTTVEDIAPKYPELETMNFQEISLNEELTARNYEITSSEYTDFMFPTIKEYYTFEVDTIV